MEVFTDNIYIPSYSGPSFHFCSEYSWHHCREVLHKHIENNFFYYLIGPNQDIEFLIENLSKLEKKIKIPKDQKLKILKHLKNKKVIKVELSKWWEDPVRFNFLTAFIKSCKESFEKTILDSPYFQQTKVATDLFLSGKTCFTGRIFRGWMKNFQNKKIVPLNNKSRKYQTELDDI